MTTPSQHSNLTPLNTTITATDIDNPDKFKHIVDKSNIHVPLVAVFCGSRMGKDPIFEQTAHKLGTTLAENGFGLVYGAGSVGLMGVISNTMVQQQATVIGVIPKFLSKKEQPTNDLTRLYFTDTMHTRKSIMAAYADAFITLPGGQGTLEEIMEIATWRQLNQHQKPMIFINIKGYYDHLFQQLKNSVEEGFLSQKELDNLIICDDVDSVLKVLNIRF